MLLRRLTIGFSAVGLLGSPAARLYCPTDDPAAMACCQRDANDCNRPGKDDDCCRTVPTDGQAAVVASKAADLARPQRIAAPAAALPMLGLSVTLPGLNLGVPESRVAQGFSPPPLSVLRI